MHFHRDRLRWGCHLRRYNRRIFVLNCVIDLSHQHARSYSSGSGDNGHSNSGSGSGSSNLSSCSTGSGRYSKSRSRSSSKPGLGSWSSYWSIGSSSGAGHSLVVHSRVGVTVDLGLHNLCLRDLGLNDLGIHVVGFDNSEIREFKLTGLRINGSGSDRATDSGRGVAVEESWVNIGCPIGGVLVCRIIGGWKWRA
jgi:hypothetical protein